MLRKQFGSLLLRYGHDLTSLASCRTSNPQAKCVSKEGIMSYPKVVLGRAARDSVHNIAKLEKQAAAVAERITIPSGVEFARFDHGGKTYAISVKLLVEVELLNNRVPNVVLRTRQKPGR
jgi:hypothetical protein